MHRLESRYAINASSAAWITLPYAHFTPPEGTSSRGVGDVTLGWGYIVERTFASSNSFASASSEVSDPAVRPVPPPGRPGGRHPSSVGRTG